jgi:EpsI family protein
VQRLEGRIIILISLLLLTGAMVWIHWFLYVGQESGGNLAIPFHADQWVGKEQVVPDSVVDILQADSVMIRTYSNKDQWIWLALVFYKDNLLGFHAPESCFGGLGYTLRREKTIDLFIKKWNMTVKINNLRYSGSEDERVLFYYYQIGTFVTESYFKMRLAFFLERLRFKKPGVALVELYSPVSANGVRQAEENLQDFLSYFIPELASLM